MTETKQTEDKIFIDTNVLVYAYSIDEPSKMKIVQEIVSDSTQLYISTQVINEFANVMLRKSRMSVETLLAVIHELDKRFYISIVDIETIAQGVILSQKYRYSYFDSLMIASALQTSCDFLYTEDLHAGQKIQNHLTIINPFN